MMVVREAGDVVTDYAGGAWLWCLERARYVASNSRVYAGMREVLNPVAPA